MLNFLLSEKTVYRDLAKKKRVWVEESNEDGIDGLLFTTENNSYHFLNIPG